MVSISPECMVEERNIWKHEHKRTVKGESPLTRYLGIEMIKLMARKMDSYWHAQKCLGGQPTPELELAQGLVKKTQHSYYKASTVLTNNGAFPVFS